MSPFSSNATKKSEDSITGLVIGIVLCSLFLLFVSGPATNDFYREYKLTNNINIQSLFMFGLAISIGLLIAIVIFSYKIHQIQIKKKNRETYEH